jgi:hypothetical protein
MGNGIAPHGNRENEVIAESSGDEKQSAFPIQINDKKKQRRSRPKKEVQLSRRQLLILRAMLALGALNSDSRRRVSDIADRAEGASANVDGYKRPLADLNEKGFVRSKEGAGGGSWLTRKGASRAQKLPKL